MFSTSGDVLNLVLSVSIVALSTFLCIALAYLISSLQKTHRIIKRIESGVTKLEEVVGLAREKLKSGAAYFMILGEFAKKALEFFLDKKREDKGEKTKTKVKNR